MYEPIIDPMIFYWIDILEKAEILPPLTLLGGFLGDFFICFFRFSVLFLFMAFLYRHFGGEVRILSGITMDKYSFY